MSPEDHRLRQLILGLILAVWGLSVAWLTLRSMGIEAPDFARSRLCVVCGSRGMADLILNWILFIPLGLVLGWLTSFRRALAISLVLTLGIEFTQIFLPGRVTSLNDVVTNCLGGVSGAWLARHLQDRLTSFVGLALVCTVWVAPGYLLEPVVSSSPLYGHWDSNEPGFQFHFGEVTSATLDGVPLVPARLPDQESSRSALLDRAPLSIELVASSPPPSLAQILAIYDRREREQVFIGALEEDLVLRSRTRARAWRLDQPDTRWVGALVGVDPGDPVTIQIDRDRGSICMRVQEASQCGLAPGPADGWAFLLNLEGASAILRTLLSLGFALGLGALIGLWTKTWPWRLGLVLALSAAGLAFGYVSLDLRPAPIQSAALVSGAVLLGMFRHRVEQLLMFLQSTPS